jgi:hypothetical protein
VNALALLGVVGVGLSQILFEIVLENPDHFPRSAGFHLWTLAWVLILPFGALLGAETLLVRRWGRERAFQAWRASLYALLAVSFGRQLQAHYAGAIDRLLPLEAVFPLTLLLGAGVFWASARSRTKAHQFAAALGILGALLAGTYVVRAGLWGPAWRSSTSGEAAAVPGQGPPVWILLCDELSLAAVSTPDGRPDAEAFPALAALAADGVWFTEATTNHQWTHQAVPTILTGRRDPPEGARTIFQRLPETRSAMIIDPWLPTSQWIRRYGADKTRLYFRSRSEFLEGRPLKVAAYLADTFAESAFARLPSGVERRRGVSLYATLDHEIQVLLESADAGEGRVTYWHCPLPHQPFLYHADGRERAEALSFPGDVDLLWRAYREQIRYLDAILGRFVARLKERGVYEKAVIVLTSDHGLRTSGALEPGYPERRSGLVPRVPLILKAPGLAPGRSEVEYQHLDFAPTLLELLKIPYEPGDFEGRSALSGPRTSRPRWFSDEGRRYGKAEGEEVWTPLK